MNQVWSHPLCSLCGCRECLPPLQCCAACEHELATGWARAQRTLDIPYRLAYAALHEQPAAHAQRAHLDTGNQQVFGHTGPQGRQCQQGPRGVVHKREREGSGAEAMGGGGEDEREAEVRGVRSI